MKDPLATLQNETSPGILIENGFYACKTISKLKETKITQFHKKSNIEKREYTKVQNYSLDVV